MHALRFLILTAFIGFCQLIHVADQTSVSPPKLRNFRDLFNLKAFTSPKHNPFTPPTPKRSWAPKPSPKERTLQRRDVPFQQFQQPFLGVPVQIENVQEAPAQNPAGSLYPLLPKLQAPKPLVRQNETEAERAERIHKSFDRLLTFVEIVGQVDNYVSSKWKNLVKTVSNFYENEDDPYRVGAKKIYGACPHAH